jgi:hypothetical protein
VKYFSNFLGKNTDCITTHNHLPQSNAGIGNKLNTAKANDIIAPKAKNCFRIPRSTNTSPNLTAPTGPDRLLNSFFTVFAFQEKKLAHRDQSLVSVSSH